MKLFYTGQPTEEKFLEIQNELNKHISLRGSFNKEDIKTIAGADLAYWQKDNEEYAVCGRALRTHYGVKPIFVSAGNYISLDTACEFALKLTDYESHIPVPTRAADLMTHAERKRLKNI